MENHLKIYVDILTAADPVKVLRDTFPDAYISQYHVDSFKYLRHKPKTKQIVKELYERKYTLQNIAQILHIQTSGVKKHVQTFYMLQYMPEFKSILIDELNESNEYYKQHPHERPNE